MIFKLKKPKFHYLKYQININNVDIDEITSNNASSGKKVFNFIGYKHDEKVKPLCTLLLKRREYTKCFDKTKCTLFSLKRDIDVSFEGDICV